nr:helix-turn-helix domain-containing protein [Mesorhizobium caraganae]
MADIARIVSHFEPAQPVSLRYQAGDGSRRSPVGKSRRKLTCEMPSAEPTRQRCPCTFFLDRSGGHSRNGSDRLLASLDAIHEAALAGLKEHDRLVLAKNQMERRLRERRASSKLPDLLELAVSRPIVSTGMIQEMLKVSKQGALNLVGQLGLPERRAGESFGHGDCLIDLVCFTKLSNYPPMSLLPLA